MKHLLSERVATYGLLSILALVVGFHLLVMARVIPFAIVWGGRLPDESRMLAFETVSVLLNLLMLAVVGIRAGLLKLRVHCRLINGCLWGMAGIFLLNTAGNLLSANAFEKAVFTPLTLLLALFSLRLALRPTPAAGPEPPPVANGPTGRHREG
ncbi:hypothetical protein GCM10027048_22460 [Hymenobacter coalescens]